MLSFFMIGFPPYTETEKCHYYAERWLNSAGQLGRQMPTDECHLATADWN
jgi:S-adenosylmethionine synthetase